MQDYEVIDLTLTVSISRHRGRWIPTRSVFRTISRIWTGPEDSRSSIGHISTPNLLVVPVVDVDAGAGAVVVVMVLVLVDSYFDTPARNSPFVAVAGTRTR